MNKPIFEGSAVAIVTPFTSEGGVNFKKLEQLVDFIGSDAHRLDHRPPIIADGVAAIPQLYSDEYVKMVLALNPTNLLHI